MAPCAMTSFIRLILACCILLVLARALGLEQLSESQRVNWKGRNILGTESGGQNKQPRAIELSTSADSNGLDPIQNMCERFYHQSTIKNDVLYIYGGIQTFVPNNNQGSAEGNITIGTNNDMIAVDMSNSWDWKTNISEILFQPSSTPPPGDNIAPSVIRGALFAGSILDNSIYVYGGTTSSLNNSFIGYQPPPSPQYALWSYNTTANQWGQYDVSLTTPQKPSAGAYADAPDQGLAFYFNGEVTNGTSTATLGIGSSVILLEGMVVINTTARTSRNISTVSLVGSTPRTGGVLQYLPGIGRNGILVSIGGSFKDSSDVSSQDIGSLIPMDQIDIFDISSISLTDNATWYSQQATGNIPAGRVQFCSVAASASDNSSYNIYIYAGRASATKLFDDIYVLSLPSFTWTQVYKAVAPSPRYGHTCHLVSMRQMLTVGGSGSPSLTSCDWETKGVAIWDMSASQWGSAYNHFAAEYGVPDTVVTAIGGSSKGSANLTVPAGGFADTGLESLFKQKTINGNSGGGIQTLSATPLPTSSNMPTTNHAGLSKEAKEGVGIGLGLLGLLALLVIAGIPWYCRLPADKTENMGRSSFAPSPSASIVSATYSPSVPC